VIDDAGWHEIKVVQRGAQWALLIDGAVDAEISGFAVPDGSGLPVTAGARSDGGDPFAGNLDDLVIRPFARPAPSAEVARFNLDEGTGTLVTDVSGSGHDGTLLGGSRSTESTTG
jgi:hypothetical protein